MTEIKDIGGEFGLIDRVTKRFSDHRVIKGIGDDCAVIRWGEEKVMLVTTDLLVQDRHFKTQWASYEQIGSKSMEVNVSDIAAMGGVPLWAFVSLAIPKGTQAEQIDDLYRGMERSCKANGVVILGGDTTGGGLLTINIALIGECETALVRYRHGAKAGQLFCVTGDIGRSEAGLRLLIAGMGSEFPALLSSHLEPLSRIAWGRAIGPLAGAMIDISDGLASEVGHICDESGVGAEIDLSAIPIAEDTRLAAKRLGADPVAWALSGGEDYQLLFTIDGTNLGKLDAARIPYSVVGRATDRTCGRWLVSSDAAKRPLSGGYDHFV